MPPRKRAKVSAATTPLAESQPKTPIDTTATAASPQTEQSPKDLANDPWTDDQESLLFKNLIRYKPTGMHKHFRMLSISRDLRSHGYTGSASSHTRIPGIWRKLNALYDLETLDDRENGHNFAEDPDPEDADDEDQMPSFELPDDEFGDLMWARRFPPSDAERSSSPELPELQFGRDDARPISLGQGSVGSDEKEEEVEVQSSPPAKKGRAAKLSGRGVKGKAASAGRNSKAQSAVSDSVGDDEEDGEDEDEAEEESEPEDTKGGQRANKVRATRRTRKR
ncbi:hypothetical protein EJ05DRAFT_473302 [Pseudovirgaria hyperparasitica]|uniref:CT20-domain-containing protein n=1 Tax=Pseudovirgaria hyperparasitica TaxID=470096 RepID=A0A6A6WJY9_9PEZI|nr:uncharacterized protein EJ05DRAFT_473302 [Pseudovirgaria hyperparasitica]KAF2762387.1 hypothetical protein EJ05DRAFT_473302 [Pseudovirgaria hyperparasitica]